MVSPASAVSLRQHERPAMEPYDVVQRSLSPKHSTIMPVAADPVLRQQLEGATALGEVISDWVYPQEWPEFDLDGLVAALWRRLWPVVEAAVSAARAETAEQIAAAIDGARLTQIKEYVEGESVYDDGWNDGMTFAWNLARGVGTTEGQSDG